MYKFALLSAVLLDLFVNVVYCSNIQLELSKVEGHLINALNQQVSLVSKSEGGYETWIKCERVDLPPFGSWRAAL